MDFGKQWLSSPFALSQFKLTSPAELKALRESSVEYPDHRSVQGGRPGKRDARDAKSHHNLPSDNGAAAMAQATGMVRSLFSSAASPAGIDRQQVDAVVDVVDRLVYTRPTTILNLTKLKTKDEISFQHSIAVCALVGLFARHLKLEAKLVRILCVSAPSARYRQASHPDRDPDQERDAHGRRDRRHADPSAQGL